jgi:hypothetical protein
MEVKERFWSMVKRDGPYSCWEWQGYTLRDGYGAFHFQGKRIIASRFAWILTYGEIPPGMCVLHKCDNPSCVNPRHLFLGTQKDNMHDAVLKWRKSGPHNGRTKLTWPQVDAIRLLFKSGWSTRKLAKLFGVDHKTIWQIRAGKTWREPAEVMGAGVNEVMGPEAFQVGGSGVPEEGNFKVRGPEAEVLAQGKNEAEEALEVALSGAGIEVALSGAGEEKLGEAKECFLKAPEKTPCACSGNPEEGAPKKTPSVFLGYEKEEFFMKAKGMWFVTERVETPALTLEFPVGFFRSREAALAFVRGKEKSYRMRFIQSDLGEEAPSGVLEEADYCEVAEASSGSLGEAEENLKSVPEGAPCSGGREGAPEKTPSVFSGCKRREEF